MHRTGSLLCSLWCTGVGEGWGGGSHTGARHWTLCTVVPSCASLMVWGKSQGMMAFPSQPPPLPALDPFLDRTMGRHHHITCSK